MKVLYPGHRYELDHLDGEGKTFLQFVQRPPFHEPREGVWNQEVCRTLIDRLQTLNKEDPSPFTDAMIYHARMLLVLHEARALARKVERGKLAPEKCTVDPTDGHFLFKVKGDV